MPVDAGARFVRWDGDVAEADRTANPLTLTVDRAKAITPVFSRDWTYDETAGTISDGYWTLSVTGDRTALTVTGPAAGSVSTWAELYLDKPIIGGGTITSLADFFVGFQNESDNDYRLRRVVLPGTLCRIGYSAFRRCCALTCVEPFLPQTLNYFGPYSFAGCSNLKMSDLTLVGTADAGLSVPKESTSSQYNQLSSVVVTNVTFGEYVTTYPMGAMPGGVKDVRYLGEAVDISGTGLNQYGKIHFAHMPTYADGNFSKWTAYGSRIYVGNGDQAWMDYVNDSANVTRWADLDETVRAKFKAAEGERHPFGLFTETAFAPRQWVFIWKLKPQGFSVIVR